MRFIQKLLKIVFVVSLIAAASLHFFKDQLPPATFYDLEQLGEPIQQPTTRAEFLSRVEDERYVITPKFDYELEGVIVSYNNAGDFTDYFHRVWKDFLNLRDLCVIWGDNVESGIYLETNFHNDSWTCWVQWPSHDVRKRFDIEQLSNNHVLIDNAEIEKKLMRAGPGDHIRIKGVLADYRNARTGSGRWTSITRTDTGNGACETIYVTDFEVVKKANRGLRLAYAIAKWSAIAALIGMVLMFVFAPYRGSYATD